MRNELGQFLEEVGVSEISAASFVREIELECSDPMLSANIGKSSGTTKHFDGEQALDP